MLWWYIPTEYANRLARLFAYSQYWTNGRRVCLLLLRTRTCGCRCRGVRDFKVARHCLVLAKDGPQGKNPPLELIRGLGQGPAILIISQLATLQTCARLNMPRWSTSTSTTTRIFEIQIVNSARNRLLCSAGRLELSRESSIRPERYATKESSPTARATRNSRQHEFGPARRCRLCARTICARWSVKSDFAYIWSDETYWVNRKC
jgi:hypothetical protein